MHEIMNQFVNVAFIDADLILYVVDITDKKSMSLRLNVSKNGSTCFCFT